MDIDNLEKRKEELTNIIKMLRREKKDKLEKNKKIHKNIELFYRISILFEIFLFITSVVNWSWNVLITIFSIDILGDIYYIVRSKCINKKYDNIIKDKELELKLLSISLTALDNKNNDKEQSKDPHTYSFQPNNKSILQNDDYQVKNNNQGKKYIKRR